MAELSIFYIIIISIIILMIAYYYNMPVFGWIITLAVITGRFSDTPSFLIGYKTSPIVLFIPQIIIDTLMLFIFIFGVVVTICYYINLSNNFYIMLKQYRKYYKHTHIMAVAVISLICIFIHQMNNTSMLIFPAIISLIIVISFIRRKYKKQKRFYLSQIINHQIAVNNQKRVNEQYLKRKRIKQNLLDIKRKKNIHKRHLQYLNSITVKLNKCKKLINDYKKAYDYNNNKINFDYIHEFNKCRHILQIRLNNIDIDIKSFQAFQLPSKSIEKIKITDDDYQQKYLKETSIFTDTSTNVIREILLQGSTKRAYDLLNNHMHLIFTLSGKNLEKYIKCLQNNIKYLQRYNLLQFQFNSRDAKSFISNAYRAGETFKKAFIGDVGEKLVKNTILEPEKYSYHQCHSQLSFKEFLKKHHFIIYSDVNLYAQSRNSLNNQIDILIINRNGLFAFEVKTYGDPYLMISAKGNIWESHFDLKDSSNRRKYVKMIKDKSKAYWKKNHEYMRLNNIYQQTNDHVSDMADLFSRIPDDKLNPYSIRKYYGHSPLVWVRKQNAKYVSNNVGYASRVKCLHPDDCWGYMNDQNNDLLNNYQINEADNLIKKGINCGKIHGVPFKHYVLDDNFRLNFELFIAFKEGIKASVKVNDKLKKYWEQKHVRNKFNDEKYKPKINQLEQNKQFYESILS